MNVISYNDKDLQTLYNKYRMSSYYPNETMKTTQNQPQYTAIGNHNLLLNSSLSLCNNNNNKSSPNNNFNPNLKPIPSIAERNRQKLLQESDTVFDDLELYGLVLTNDLLKLRRLQEMTNKNDFSLEFSSFRKRLYTNIDTIGEKMVNTIKNISTEFESTNSSIVSYFKRNLSRNTEINSKLENPIKDLGEGINEKVNKMDNLFKKRAERFKTLKYFLYPPKLESGIVLPKELTIDWEKRMERLKHTHAYKKLNEEYAQKLLFAKQKMDLLNKVAVKEERVRNIKYRDYEKQKKENQMNFLKEQEQRELDMIEEMDKFQKELEEEEKKKMEELEKQKELEEIERQRKLEETENRSDSEGSDMDERYKKLRKNGKENEDDDDNEEEEEYEKIEKIRDKEYDFTDLLTKKYQKSDKKSEISGIPPAFLFRENKH